MNNPDFALQWLDFLGNKIYNNGQQIFKYHGEPRYDISRIQSRIRIGDTFGGDEEGEKKFTVISFSELEELGLTIIAKDDLFWKPRQKCYFKLARKAVDLAGITKTIFTRAGITIQHDAPNKRTRIMGEFVLAAKESTVQNGVGDWMSYEIDTPMKMEFEETDALTRSQYRAIIERTITGKEESENSIKYMMMRNDEIPIMISDEKYVVCIPKQSACQRIIVVGEPRTGKSVFTDAWASRVGPNGIWQNRVGWLIDPMNQFYDLSLLQDYPPFNKINSYVNNPPRPVPAVQQYLACNSPIEVNHPNISLTVTQSFLEYLKKYKFYTYGIKDYDVGDSIRYLPDYVDVLKDATSGDEVFELMREAISNFDKDKGMQAMAYKWKNTFETIFQEKFTSNLYKDNPTATDELEVVFKDGSRLKGHPFIMCYEAGLVPVLNIAAAKLKRWTRNYLADLMQKIVAHQIAMGQKQHRVWIIADELNEIYERGKKKDNASSSFEQLERQGGFNNIGFVGNTQSLKKLNPEMYDAATHICCTYMKDSKSRKMIADTYDTHDILHKIEELKEREMIAFSKQPWITYDRWGRRREEKNRKWFKGTILPPMNHHKIPLTRIGG